MPSSDKDEHERQSLYQAVKKDSDEHVKRVISSNNRKKIVAAGPGTGKTHLFKEALAGKEKALVLTFINALVEDLHVQLPGGTHVRTLHGFARSVIASKGRANPMVYNDLADVIERDAEFLGITNRDFASKIRNLADQSELSFYFERKNYYGNYFSHDDLIYEAVKLLNNHPENIDLYDQILIDEFQDFNPLDVALIDLLSSKSPVLLAGDDDQSLYAFRDSSHTYLRDRYSDGEYEAFTLPYCYRCPEVVVDAVNDILDYAKGEGLLGDRIDKAYKYAASEKKDDISKRFPNIVHVTRNENAICTFIENELKKIVQEEDDNFNVLVVSPYSASNFQRRLLRQFRRKGFVNVEPRDKPEATSLLRGMQLILETNQQFTNLGWRIVAEQVMTNTEFKKALKESTTSSKPFYKLLDRELVRRVKSSASLLRKVSNTTRPLSEDESSDLWNFLDLDPSKVVNRSIREDLALLQHPGIHIGIRGIPIRVTNVLKSKGLSADYVFITHLDDRFFLEDSSTINEVDIFNILVALSRTKKKVYLISTPNARSTIVNVIQNGNASVV